MRTSTGACCAATSPRTRSGAPGRSRGSAPRSPCRAGAPVLVGGPDAADMLAVAAGRGLVLLDARAAGERELVSRASLVAALEDRALVLRPMRAAGSGRAGDLEGDDRVEPRSRGPVRRHGRRGDATRGAGCDRGRDADADAGRAARGVGRGRWRR